MHCEDQRHLGLCLGYAPAPSRACAVHARPLISTIRRQTFLILLVTVWFISDDYSHECHLRNQLVPITKKIMVVVPIRHFCVTSHDVSKPRALALEWFDRFAIWHGYIKKSPSSSNSKVILRFQWKCFMYETVYLFPKIYSFHTNNAASNPMVNISAVWLYQCVASPTCFSWQVVRVE